MLNIHWTSEKLRKISSLNIMSTNCLQAIKWISVQGKGVRKSEASKVLIQLSRGVEDRKRGKLCTCAFHISDKYA